MNQLPAKGREATETAACESVLTKNVDSRLMIVNRLGFCLATLLNSHDVTDNRPAFKRLAVQMRIDDRSHQDFGGTQYRRIRPRSCLYGLQGQPRKKAVCSFNRPLFKMKLIVFCRLDRFLLMRIVVQLQTITGIIKEIEFEIAQAPLRLPSRPPTGANRSGNG